MMRCDNKGEGGLMALMALALRPIEEGSRRRKVIPNRVIELGSQVVL